MVASDFLHTRSSFSISSYSLLYTSDYFNLMWITMPTWLQNKSPAYSLPTRILTPSHAEMLGASCLLHWGRCSFEVVSFTYFLVWSLKDLLITSAPWGINSLSFHYSVQDLFYFLPTLSQKLSVSYNYCYTVKMTPSSS